MFAVQFNLSCRSGCWPVQTGLIEGTSTWAQLKHSKFIFSVATLRVFIQTHLFKTVTALIVLLLLLLFSCHLCFRGRCAMTLQSLRSWAFM